MKNKPSDRFVEDLLDFAREEGLTGVEWEKGDRRVSFKRGSVPPAVSAVSPVAKEPVAPPVHLITSPMVGTFFRSAKDRPPLVVDGGTVTVGQRLAVVEAMRVPKDVLSDVAGKVVRVLVDNGTPVEYGQALFEIEPEDGGHV